VGQKGSALQALHDVVTNKRHRTWSKTFEDIMFKHLDLVVELKKRNYAKEALMQYRNMCQAVNINSLEEVIKHFLKRASEKAEEAQGKAAVGDCAGARTRTRGAALCAYMRACMHPEQQQQQQHAGCMHACAHGQLPARPAAATERLTRLFPRTRVDTGRHARRGGPGGGRVARGNHAQLRERRQDQGGRSGPADSSGDPRVWRAARAEGLPALLCQCLHVLYARACTPHARMHQATPDTTAGKWTLLSSLICSQVRQLKCPSCRELWCS